VTFKKSRSTQSPCKGGRLWSLLCNNTITGDNERNAFLHWTYVAHTPVILATWDAEIRRNTVQGQTRQIILKTLSLKYPKHRADGVAQVTECLLSKPEALSSNPTTAKKNQKNKKLFPLSIRLQRGEGTTKVYK
jgi:hypothetical protein